MSIHNICFCREIRKILCGYPLLSVAMTDVDGDDCHYDCDLLMMVMPLLLLSLLSIFSPSQGLSS